MCSLFYEDNSDLNESFIAVVQLARDDREIFSTISQIINLTRAERHHLLDRLLWSLHQERAPDDFIEAIGYLYDDSLVERLKEYIGE